MLWKKRLQERISNFLESKTANLRRNPLPWIGLCLSTMWMPIVTPFSMVGKGLKMAFYNSFRNSWRSVVHPEKIFKSHARNDLEVRLGKTLYDALNLRKSWKLNERFNKLISALEVRSLNLPKAIRVPAIFGINVVGGALSVTGGIALTYIGKLPRLVHNIGHGLYGIGSINDLSKRIDNEKSRGAFERISGVDALSQREVNKRSRENLENLLDRIVFSKNGPWSVYDAEEFSKECIEEDDLFNLHRSDIKPRDQSTIIILGSDSVRETAASHARPYPNLPLRLGNRAKSTEPIGPDFDRPFE